MSVNVFSNSVLMTAGNIVAVRMLGLPVAESVRRPSMKSRRNHSVPPQTASPGKASSPATDEVALTCPDFCARNSGSTATTPLSTPLTLTSTIRCHSSVLRANSDELGIGPALRKMAFTRPNLSVANLAMASFSDCKVTSNSWYTAWPPRARISSLIRFRLAARRAPSTIFAPLFASSLAVAAPIPDEAPVVMTTLSLIMMLFCLFAMYRQRMPA